MSHCRIWFVGIWLSQSLHMHHAPTIRHDVSKYPTSLPVNVDLLNSRPLYNTLSPHRRQAFAKLSHSYSPIPLSRDFLRLHPDHIMSTRGKQLRRWRGTGPPTLRRSQSPTHHAELLVWCPIISRKPKPSARYFSTATNSARALSARLVWPRRLERDATSTVSKSQFRSLS
jgi:hypothetical protein